MTGRHEEERPRRNGRKVGLITLGLLLLAGVAVAIFYLIGGFSGSVDAANYTVTPTVANTLSGTCDATIIGDDIDIEWSGVVGGDQCVLDLQWSAGLNDGPLRLQDFHAPDGLTYALVGCGVTFNPGAVGNGVITLTLTADTPFMGATFDSSVDGGVFVRSADYSAGLCPA